MYRGSRTRQNTHTHSVPDQTSYRACKLAGCSGFFFFAKKSDRPFFFFLAALLPPSHPFPLLEPAKTHSPGSACVERGASKQARGWIKDNSQLTLHGLVIPFAGKHLIWLGGGGVCCFFLLFPLVVLAVMLAAVGGDARLHPLQAAFSWPPCLSDTQRRSSGSKRHSTRSSVVLCLCCFFCVSCCYSCFSSLGICRPVNLAALSAARFWTLFFFFFSLFPSLSGLSVFRLLRSTPTCTPLLCLSA